MSADAYNPGLELSALLCYVFEKDEGPIVRCMDPPNEIDKTLIKPLGRYLLPEKSVAGRVVSMVVGDQVVLGSPVYIEDTLYDRNCFQFNICMVIKSLADAEPYRDLAQHLAAAFQELEKEIKLISRPEEVERVQLILAALRSQLKTADECFQPVGGSRCIAFRVRRQVPVLSCGNPELSDVPIPLVNIPELLESAGLPFQPDLMLLRVVPFLDGLRTVGDVVTASGLSQDCVFTCVRHLLHFQLLRIIDAVRPDNRYCLTAEFHCFLERQDIQRDVVLYVTAGRQCGEDGDVTVEDVHRLYAQVDGWAHTLHEFEQKHAEELKTRGISIRHFIVFGLLRGLLQRIDIYSQALNTEEIQELQQLRSKIVQLKKELEARGMSKVQVNQDKQVQDMVSRMDELRVREKHRGRCRVSSGSLSSSVMEGVADGTEAAFAGESSCGVAEAPRAYGT